MNRMVIEVLRIQNELLEERINQWNPREVEMMKRSKELLEVLTHGNKLNEEDTVFFPKDSDKHNPFL